MALSRRVAGPVVAVAVLVCAAYVISRAMRTPVQIEDGPVDDALLRLAGEVGFGDSDGLDGWGEVAFEGNSTYSLTTDEEGIVFLEASSRNACSGIFKQVSIPMSGRPHLSWEWRVTEFPSKKDDAQLGEKSSSDFAARVCAVFAGRSPFTSRYIYYVWDDEFPEGSREKSSGAWDRTRILVVEDSGGGDGSNWVREIRDVVADYRMLFGKDPELSFSAVGIMTDSDGSHSASAAEFRRVQIHTVAPTGSEGRVNQSE